MKKYAFSTIPKVGNRRDFSEARLHARIPRVVWPFLHSLSKTKRLNCHIMQWDAQQLRRFLFWKPQGRNSSKSACMTFQRGLVWSRCGSFFVRYIKERNKSMSLL
jgi:hypothetical protein